MSGLERRLGWPPEEGRGLQAWPESLEVKCIPLAVALKPRPKKEE